MSDTTENVVTAAAGLFPAQTEEQLFVRISKMCRERRLTAPALGAFFDALETQPHADMGEPADAREKNMADRCMADALRDAGNTVRDECSRLYDRTPHKRAQGANFDFVDGQNEEGDVNMCALCCVPKSECPDVAAHFGAKGESPPYTECPGCGRYFHSNYDSTKRLAVHRATEGECKPKERDMYERMKNLPPAPLTTCWGTARPAKKPRKPRPSRAKGAQRATMEAVSIGD